MITNNYIPRDVYYAVYLKGNELPTAIFIDLELAEWFCEHSDCSLRKEIRTVDFWSTAVSLFLVKTQLIKVIQPVQYPIKPLSN